MIERVLPAILLLVLAACGGNGDSEPGSGPADSAAAAAPAPAVLPAADSQAPSASAPVVLDSGGVSVTDAAGRPVTLRFGMDRVEVVAALTCAAGAPGEQGENAECGGGAATFARWANGLTLWFSEDQFGGWAVDDRAPAAGLPRTASGVSTGSTRAALDGAYTATVQETSLGQEFDAQGIYGVLSGTGPDARITALWGGTTCIFR